MPARDQTGWCWSAGARMTEMTILIPVAMVVIAIGNWRSGLGMLIATALLEGPLRKLAPDQPVHFVLLPAVVFGAMILSAMVSGVSIRTGTIAGWSRHVALPFAVYAGWILLQALNALSTTGSLVVPIYGILVYLGPIAAIAFAHQAALRMGFLGVEEFLWRYGFWAGLTMLTVYLEASSFDWTVLGEVGEGITITDAAGSFSARSGLFRASEVAAWHGAACCCLMITLAMRRGLSMQRAIWLLLFLALMIGAGILTGRRKMLVTVVVFLCSYTALLFLFTVHAKRLAGIVAGLGLVGFVGAASFIDLTQQSLGDRTISYELYLQRQQSSFSEIPERLVSLGIAPIEWALERVGPLGGGVGISGQGARFVGVDASLVGGAGEGGLGKIVVEIGLPGLAIALWLAIAFGRVINAGMAATAEAAPILSPLGLGLAAMLVSNVASYTVATQAFGDPFVLILLGLITGFLLAQPKLAERYRDAMQEREQAVSPLEPVVIAEAAHGSRRTNSSPVP